MAGGTRWGAHARRSIAAALALAALLPGAGGCSFGDTPERAAPSPAPSRPAQGPARASGEARPTGPPAAGGGSGASAGNGGTESEGGSIARLAADLDHADQRVVFSAASGLLDARDESRALPELAKRLKDGRVEAQRTIVFAIGRYPRAGSGRSPATIELVKSLFPLLRPFLGHADLDLRNDAVVAVAALDALDPTDVDDDVAKEIESILSAPKDKGPSVAERVSAVRVTGRKPPKTAVRLLMVAFERTQIADVRDEARKELKRLTGQSFRSADELRAWFEKNQEKSQDQWYQDRIERIEADTRDARENARFNWNRYRQTLVDDPPKYWAELESAVKSSVVYLIRIDAARCVLETGKAEGYDLVTAVVRDDKDLEVRRGAIEALAKAPPTDPQVRARVIEGLLPLTEAPEKDVRQAAVACLGEYRAERAVDALLKRISNPQRDAEVASEALRAITKIAPRADGSVGKALNDFLQREIDRPGVDPLRDPKLVELGAATMRALQWPEGSTEADRASAILVKILEATIPPDGGKPPEPKVLPPRFESRARVVAVISIAALRRTASLKSLVQALADQDDNVAAEAARAVGAIVMQKGVDPREREPALQALVLLLDASSTAQKDAALDAISEAFKTDPTNLQLLSKASSKLGGAAKDYARLVRLLKDLPPRLPAETPAPVRLTHQALRRSLAEAYENVQPTPDPKAALEIWQDLARDDPDGQGSGLEDYAKALAALPSEKADEVYVDLIKKKPENAARYWLARVALVRRFVDLALEGKSKEIDRVKARALLDRVLADRAGAPVQQKLELEELDRRLGKAPAAGALDPRRDPARPMTDTTVPGGLKREGRAP